MNWVDVILALVFLFAVLAGWSRGFILGSLDLLTWTGSLILGYIFYPYMVHWYEKIFHPGIWLLPLSFLLTTLIAWLLIGAFARYIARSIPEKVDNNGLNKFLGLIPGVINGWLCIIILSALLLALPLKDSVTKETRNSRLAGKLAMQSEWANRKLAPVFDDAIRQTMNSLIVHPRSDEIVTLPFKYEKAEVRPLLEARMLEMVNKERTSRGLKPVIADPEMTQVARAHSKDMFARGYFAHMNPDHKDPFERMKDANVSFLAAGENLALAQTLEIAHNNLMNSEGHRANILNPSFGRLGIGILDGGYYGIMISQEFRN